MAQGQVLLSVLVSVRPGLVPMVQGLVVAVHSQLAMCHCLDTVDLAREPEQGRVDHLEHNRVAMCRCLDTVDLAREMGKEQVDHLEYNRVAMCHYLDMVG